MMNSHEMFLKNQQLSMEFALYILDHPEVADRIPEGALVVFLPEFDKSLAKKNRAVVAKLKEKEQPVVYVGSLLDGEDTKSDNSWVSRC